MLVPKSKLANNYTVTVKSNDIEFLEDQVKDTQYKIQRIAGEFNVLEEKKFALTVELCERKETLYIAQNKNIKVIAREVLEYVNSVGIIHNFGDIYERIPNKYKQDNAKQLKKLFDSSSLEGEGLNMSPEEKAEELLDEALQELEQLPESRKKKFYDKAKEKFAEDDEEDEVKEGDFGIHQAEPPEGMQGPNEFSEAVRGTANWFRAAAERYDKIADEIETYKPQNADRIRQKAEDWKSCVGGVYRVPDEEDPTKFQVILTGSMIGKIFHPIFMTETKAEADRKYSTSIFHWIGIIKNRIEQSKHGAGKMAENFITDPFGHVVYNRKNKPIKKSISRERVGDFEWPIVDMAIELIAANSGLYQLHDWLENDQGGYRRYRKEFLHDYFAEASMGSIKSGNPEYEQFMRDYKKKQLEKFQIDVT